MFGELSRRGLIGGGAAMVSRLIDPTRHIERAADARHGIATMGDLRRSQDQSGKLDAEFRRTQRFIAQETSEVHAANVPANTTGTIMLHMVYAGAGAVGTSAVIPRVSQQCRMTHLRILSTSTVTAGTIVPALEVLEPDLGASIISVFDELQLDTTLDEYGNTISSKSMFLDWESAPQLAKGEFWRILLNTNAAYAPTTNDYKCIVTFSVDEWVS